MVQEEPFHLVPLKP